MAAPKLKGWRNYTPLNKESLERLRSFSRAYQQIAPVSGDGAGMAALERTLDRTPGFIRLELREMVAGMIWAVDARFKPHPGDPTNVRILFPYALPQVGFPELPCDVAIYMQGRAVEPDAEKILGNLEIVFSQADRNRLMEEEILPEQDTA